MKKVESDLLGSKYTELYQEEFFSNNAPHYFEVSAADTKQKIGHVHFQEGPVKEVGVNGVMNEDLISMVICRLMYFNQTDFACRENSMAITKLQESLMWLGKRTKGRNDRGVEGTHKV